MKEELIHVIEELLDKLQKELARPKLSRGISIKIIMVH